MIGILAALSVEAERLVAALEEAQTIRLAGQEAHVGRIGGQDVAVMRCGVGKVAAALAAQAMIAQLPVDELINTGCAGALAPGLGVGDVVLSTATVEWDMDTTALGDPRGYISGFDRIFMEADAALRACLRRCAPADVRVTEGLIASGDQFITTPAQRSLILDAFPDALCAEMEGAAIGHVCAVNGVPFCVVRTMSDTADGNSTVDFPTFAKQAGETSAAMILRLLRG